MAGRVRAAARILVIARKTLVAVFPKTREIAGRSDVGTRSRGHREMSDHHGMSARHLVTTVHRAVRDRNRAIRDRLIDSRLIDSRPIIDRPIGRTVHRIALLQSRGPGRDRGD